MKCWVLTAVTTDVAVIWDVPPWSLVEMFRLGVRLASSVVRVWPVCITRSLHPAYSATLLMEQQVFPKRRCANRLYSITFPHHVKGRLVAGPPLLVIGPEVDNSPPFGAEARNEWRYTSTSPYV